MTFRQAAACLNVSPATAHRWWHRYAVAFRAKATVDGVGSGPLEPPAPFAAVVER